MWDVRHEASKTDEEIFWALSLLALFNYLLCPDMKLTSSPFSHTIRTKQAATKGTQSRQILQYRHGGLGPSTCEGPCAPKPTSNAS